MLAVTGAGGRWGKATGTLAISVAVTVGVATTVLGKGEQDRAGRSAPAAVEAAGKQATEKTPADPRSGVRRATSVVASKAQGVLERHCSRCHQNGYLGQGVAAGGFANVTAVDELAREPAMVRPGLPDASRLYNVLATRELHQGAVGMTDGAWPGRQEIDAVRAWIDELPASVQKACGTYADGRRRAVSADIAAAIERLGAPRASRTRLVSLAHLAGCVTSEEMVGLEQGLTFVLNAASRSPKAVAPTRVGSSEIWMISLDDLGWEPAQWETLVADYPLKGGAAKLVPAAAKSAMATNMPLVQADWLADVAMRAPHYGRLIGLPDALGALAARSGIDIDRNIRSGEARRIAIARSGETAGARIIERHPPSDSKRDGGGPLWLSYELDGGPVGEMADPKTKAARSGKDAATGKGNGNSTESRLDKPLGPAPHGRGETRFKADGMRAIFRLGSGFPAFAMFGAEGRRIERVPSAADRPIAGDPYAGEAALGCLQCHLAGPVAGKDEVRRRLQAATSSTLEAARGEVSRPHARPEEHAALAASDHYATRSALLAGGIDPERRVRGLLPPLALALAWRRPVDAGRLAGELGIPPEAFRARLARLTEGAPIAARQLLQGTAQREEAMKLVAWLDAPPMREGAAAGPSSAAVGAQEATATTTAGPTADGVITPAEAARIGRIDLALWTDGEQLAAGDSVVFRAQSTRDCNLTLISVDKDGRATVVFPNDYERNNRIAAGQAIRVPSAAAGYRFRLDEPGQELLVGICSATHVSPKSIVHNYDRLRFTVLGDWELFLREPPRLDFAGRDDAATDRPRPLRQRWRRRRKALIAKRPEGPDVSARSAIVIRVGPPRQ